MERRHHVELWLFAFLAFVVGDSVTTAAGLSAGAAESNPLAATVLEVAGRPGFDRATPYDIDDEAALFVPASASS